MVDPSPKVTTRAAPSTAVTGDSAKSSMSRSARKPATYRLASGPATGRVIGWGVEMATPTRSRTPWARSRSSTSNAASNGAGGHLKGPPRMDTSTRPPSTAARASCMPGSSWPS